MKNLLLTCLMLLWGHLCNAQIIFNEVQADAGNFEGLAEWIELQNTGPVAQDLSCWRISNGGSLQITIPAGLVLPAGNFLLIGNASKMMCSSCDFKYLNQQFSLNADGFGFGVGNYSQTIFLNTESAANGGCNCLTGSGNLNNGNLNGDRLVLFDDAGNIADAMMYAGGNAYGNNAITVNFNAVNGCPPMPAIVIPDVNDSIFSGRKICNDLSACNSSFARMPDGNNGNMVLWSQSGNLACNLCTNPCGALTNTGSEDMPTPGISNNSLSFTASINGNPVLAPHTTVHVCGATPIHFEFQVYNFMNVALTAIQSSGNLGSYVRVNNGSAGNFQTAGFDSLSGITLLSTNIIPPVGTTHYEFVWGDANTNCAICPGSSQLSIPNNPLSPAKECYLYRKVSVIREDSLAGSPNASCSIPGSITVSGVTGTQIKYTLQKQSVIGGTFNTISGPQSGNSFSGIVDDDADPALPNYQILISSTNITCINPPPLVVSVPGVCMGNPECAAFATSGPGMPSFFPPGNSSLCTGTEIHFTAALTGVCANGLVEVLCDYDSLFNPYTTGILLGSSGTTTGAVPAAQIATGKVFINEFAPRPAQGTCAGTPNGQNANSGEWVELYNAGPGAVDIGGWVISDGDWSATIPAGVVMQMGSYYLIGGGGTFCSAGIIPDLNIETCNCTGTFPANSDIMNLTDGGEQLSLFDCSGNFIDGVLWAGGQSLPDNTNNVAPPTGCGNYIAQQNLYLPAALSFSNSGGAFSGSNEGRYRTSTNTWVTFLYGGGTPKAPNPTVYTGSTVLFGMQCSPPPVTSHVVVNVPDTCLPFNSTEITLKAVYKPQPVAPCTPAYVISAASYSIPGCTILTLSGSGEYCIPANAPITISTSNALVGDYYLNLSNGVDSISMGPLSGAGPFSTSVYQPGAWHIQSVTPPAGSCKPKAIGEALISMHPVPQIVAYPDTVDACFLYGFDLSAIEPQITTSPQASSFLWYSDSLSVQPINTFISPTLTQTYYVSPGTGAPAYCEGIRVPVVVKVRPIPDIPQVICGNTSITFIQPNPNCIPSQCSAVEYSANGIAWSNSNTFTAADAGWAAWGSPANSTLYIRNAQAPQCLNYVTFLNPCNAPLPEHLLFFTVQLNSHREAELKWQFSGNGTIALYEVERSGDSRNFINIGQIGADLFSQTESKFAYTDRQPYSGMNYYRLKMWNVDGQYVYSEIVSAENAGQMYNTFHVYPNPVQNHLLLEMNMDKIAMAQISVVDQTGKELWKGKRKLSKGINTITHNTGSYTKGVYLIKVKTGDHHFIQRFCKE